MKAAPPLPTPLSLPLLLVDWLIGKDPDAGKDWRQEKKGLIDDEMVGWMWVWENSGSWWWTGRPGMLRFMELQRVGHNWMTERNWTESRKSRNSLNPRWDPCLLWGWWWGGEVLRTKRKMLITSTRKIQQGFPRSHPVVLGSHVQDCRQSRFPFGTFRTIPLKVGKLWNVLPIWASPIQDVSLCMLLVQHHQLWMIPCMPWPALSVLCQHIL